MWADRANCKNKAFELFEYQDHESPLTKDMTRPERIEMNQANFDRAGEICIECTVFFECLASATAEDRDWTVRGGEVPLKFQSELKWYASVSAKSDYTCKNGHFVEGGGRCMECHKAWNRERMKRIRAEKKAAQGAPDKV